MMYRTAKKMKRALARKINYNTIEMQSASDSLTEEMGGGSLKWLKTKFEHYPLEAVPNVWEGDEGMMKHVPKFPMPPYVALAIKKPDAGQIGDDLEIGKTSTDAYTDFGLELKRRGMERKFWIKMAKTVMTLETMNQSITRLRTKFANEGEKIRTNDCQQLFNLYKQMQKIKCKLDKADGDYTRNGFTDMFKTMPPSKKVWFKRQHALQGKLPDNMGHIVKKYNFVRTKIRNIIHKNSEKLQEFPEILTTSIMKDALIKFNKDSLSLKVYANVEENKNDEATCMETDDTNEQNVSGDNAAIVELNSGEKLEKPKKRKLSASDIMSKEDLFWENVTDLKRMMHKTTLILSRIGKATLSDNSSLFRKAGLIFSRDLLSTRRCLINFTNTLVKLKEEKQAGNYVDKKLFTAEDLTSQRIDDLTPDDSLAVVEALLNKLKTEYFRVQDEKYVILEKLGYTRNLGLENPPTDENVKLVRVCAHSKTVVDMNDIGRYIHEKSNIKKGNHQVSPGDLHKQNETGQQIDQATISLDAGTDGQQKSEAVSGDHSENADVDVIKSENLPSEDVAGNKHTTASVNASGDVSVGRNTAGTDSVPVEVDPVEDDGSAESSPEDMSDSKTVNSLSFFMKNLEPGVFIVGEQSSSESVTDDFKEREKEYWNRLQKLFRRIDKNLKQVCAKGSRSYRQKRQIRDAMKSIHYRVKQVSDNYELEKIEGYRAGFCDHVTYENLENLPETTAEMLVKNLDQMKDKIDSLYSCYKATSEKLGVPYMFKL